MTTADRSGSPVVPLLPGEDSQSDVLDDAEHWVAVYEDLIRSLLDLGEPNIDKVLTFSTRLDYWRHRRDELAH